MQGEAGEEYLRAFYYLQKKNGEVKSSRLADYLKVSKAGVTEMLRALSERGLVQTEKYRPAKLTRRGLALAKKMTFRHRVLECFLSERLGIPPAKVHQEASRLEHAISDTAVKRLYVFLGRPQRDPHGSPIMA